MKIKNVDISHLDDMNVENKRRNKKITIGFIKKITLSSKIVEKKEPKLMLKRYQIYPTSKKVSLKIHLLFVNHQLVQ